MTALRRLHARILAAALALGGVLATDASLASAQTSTPLENTSVDPSIAPGDDFYAYANGPWLAATYQALGSEITPHWDVKQYEILDWVATAEPNARLRNPRSRSGRKRPGATGSTASSRRAGWARSMPQMTWWSADRSR